ncbi:unnamed protein product [Nesidiocoris tenuis]|uniref:Ankyrin repeat domain-containing protein 12 n=1 Tax=Nesidiocoris tenuis TaxID=355587 RepID=A0A6H5FU45_9HEMI|nr:unnamed protein product [Nesidiocoris tenuis]
MMRTVQKSKRDWMENTVRDGRERLEYGRSQARRLPAQRPIPCRRRAGAPPKGVAAQRPGGPAKVADGHAFGGVRAFSSVPNVATPRSRRRVLRSARESDSGRASKRKQTTVREKKIRKVEESVRRERGGEEVASGGGRASPSAEPKEKEMRRLPPPQQQQQQQPKETSPRQIQNSDNALNAPQCSRYGCRVCSLVVFLACADKCGGSPRVTLRIHQLKEKREKKNSQELDTYSGSMESGKGAEESGGGSAKETSSADESAGGDRISSADKDSPNAGSGVTSAPTPAAENAGSMAASSDVPADEKAGDAASATVAGVKRSHSTEDESNGSAGGTPGEDGKKRRRKEDKGKNGSGRHHLPYVVSAPPEASEAPPLPQPPTSASPNDECKDDRPGSGSEESAGGGTSIGGGVSGGIAAAGAAPPGAGSGRGHQRVLRSHRIYEGKLTFFEVGTVRFLTFLVFKATEVVQLQSNYYTNLSTKISSGATTTGGVVTGSETPSGREGSNSDAEKTATPPPPPPQELHPRKRKIRPREQQAVPPSANSGGSGGAPVAGVGTAGANGSVPGNATTGGTNSGVTSSSSSVGSSGPGSDSGADASLGGPIGTSAALESITNSYQLFLNIRKQIERKRKGLFPVQPKPPQGFKDYLMNRCTYVLANNNSNRVPPPSNKPPPDLPAGIKELFQQQEKERHRLLMQHVIEKEKLVLSVEQEILRVHGRAARALANQALPFSACTILRDEEVYSAITPEQEEKDRNARSRYNGRLFISWLQDVDDKWEKIKEAMLLRHHNEAESLHAVQKMDWEWKMKELGLCEMKSTPVIDETHVPVVHVSDDFDLLPA